MTTSSVPASSTLLAAVLHGAALGGLVAAAVLTRAQLRGWLVSAPWAVTAAWSLLGAVVGRPSSSCAWFSDVAQRSISRADSLASGGLFAVAMSSRRRSSSAR